jgi:hypothetical protein
MPPPIKHTSAENEYACMIGLIALIKRAGGIVTISKEEAEALIGKQEVVVRLDRSNGLIHLKLEPPKIISVTPPDRKPPHGSV